MDFLLDMKTIILSLVVGHLFTVVLISAYWRHHKKDSTATTFFLAKCTQGLAWLFLALRGGIPDVFTISLANSLLYVGASLETIAVLKLLKAFDAAAKKLYFALTAINIIGFHLVLFFYNEETLRIAVASFGTAVLIISPAYRLIRESSASLLMKMIGFLYFLVIVSLMGRAAAALFSMDSMGLFTPGISQTLSFLALYLIMILGNTGFVLLLKEQADQELLRLASFDDLTGVLNRRTFILRAKLCISQCAKKKLPLTLLLFDVDHFKKINDTYGHHTGDRVLQDLTGKISRQLGTEAVFGRHGGDEFAIILPGMDEPGALRLAENIKREMEEGTIPDQDASYTLSIGLLTVFPDQFTELEALYISCDKALYQAKKNGRNGVARTAGESAGAI